MLVKCLHYSVTYPTGMQRVGDIFELTKDQAEYYENIGWINILPDEIQPKGRKGKKSGNRPAIDLSKSEYNGRHLEHIYIDNNKNKKNKK